MALGAALAETFTTLAASRHVCCSFFVKYKKLLSQRPNIFAYSPKKETGMLRVAARNWLPHDSHESVSWMLCTKHKGRLEAFTLACTIWKCFGHSLLEPLLHCDTSQSTRLSSCFSGSRWGRMNGQDVYVGTLAMFLRYFFFCLRTYAICAYAN
jgi:hypothetical protein